MSLAELEREAKVHVSDLELALALMTQLHDLYFRLDAKQRGTLLQILVKKIIINGEGEIVGHRLNSPFVYLRSLADSLLSHKDNLKENNISLDSGIARDLPMGVDGFLAGLRFEQRGKLEEISVEH